MAMNPTMALARAKADVAFELFRMLDVPFFTSTTADVAPEGRSLAESVKNLNAIADLFEQKMSAAKVRLLWGTAICFRTAVTWLVAAPIRIRRCSSTAAGRSGRHSR